MSHLSQDPAHPDIWIIPDGWNGHSIIHTPLVIKGVHLSAECMGQTCLLHNPSMHHMNTWPLVWDLEHEVFLRICRHGLGHPDPDSWGDGQHPGGDDSCCRRGGSFRTG